MSAADLPTLEDMDTQVIEFLKNDDVTYYPISGSTTTVHGSGGKHTHGSSNVKLKNIVDYKWEVKQYPGRLIAAHRDGEHVAYVINVGKKGGMVRVINTRISARCLLKGMDGEVWDLEFSNFKKVLLACINQMTLFVYEITIADYSNTLNCSLWLKVTDLVVRYSSGYERITWCPYVNRVGTDSESDEEGDDEAEAHCWYIVWSKGDTFQCIDVKSPVVYSKMKETYITDLQKANYCLSYSDPSVTITTTSFSPDGSTLAVGCHQGIIRFYQIYMYDENVRCLHEWNPHKKPVSSLFFLDDINRCRTDIYWEYAITGANNNTEFKVWDCSDWTCSQTIYLSNTSEKRIQHKYIAELDPSAQYLVVSCYDLRTLYVFQITSKAHEKISLPQIIGVSEFPMQSGILSLCLSGDAEKNCKSCEYKDELEERGIFDETNCVSLDMFIVQPKSMQECRICFYKQKCEIKEPMNNCSSPLLDINISTIAQNDNESSGTGASPPTVRSISTASKTEINDSLSPHVVSTSHRNSAQLLESANDNIKSDANVSSDVFNTILLLASVAGQTSNAGKADCKNLVNNKVIEDQEQKKQQLRKSMEKEKPFVAIDNHPERHITEHMPSGTSSPSREVQEILAWEQSFSSDNEEAQQKTTVVNTSETTMKPSTTTGLKPPSAGLQNAANLIAQVVQNSSNSNHNTSSSTLENSIHETDSSNSHQDHPHNLNEKINQMLELIKMQSKQINTLQHEIEKLQNLKSSEAKNMHQLSFKIEMQLSKLLDKYLQRYEAEHEKKLTAFMAGREVQNIELRDNILQVLNQYILTQFGDVASKVIIFEIQRQLVPVINGRIDNLQKQIQIDVNQKFNAFDMMVKEHIIQVCKNKGFIEAFGKSVLGGVQGSLQNAFVESMSGTLIPAYEKASQNMFKQLHDAFHSGIKEFMEQFEVYLHQLKPQEGPGQVMQTVASVQHLLDETMLKQQHIMAETIIENRKDIKTMEILLQRHITETIKQELKKCFDQQTTTLRSQASTPAPMMYDMRENVRMLLQQGQINRAFHQALLADDLSLVEYTLKTADHNAVFIPQCCLEQKVLLSLINQISADMSTHNEIKQNYLTEALLAINLSDPITREHAPKVLQELFRNCQKFLGNFPKSPQCSNVRMLMKGVHSYIEQF